MLYSTVLAEKVLAADAADTSIDVTSPFATYPSYTDLPLSGNKLATKALVVDTNTIYIWLGQVNSFSWYPMITTNISPTAVSGNSASYTFDTIGTPIDITLNSTDPEEIPIMWSYQVTSGTLGDAATITQVDNVFTLTPSTDPADAAVFGITFTASDGVNDSESGQTTFTLEFFPDWSNPTTLFTDTGAASDQLAKFVTISADGSTAAVTRDNGSGTSTSTGIRIYVRDSYDYWALQKTYTFGYLEVKDIALSENGNVLVVGRPASNSAAVYTRSGTIWSTTPTLLTISSGANRPFEFVKINKAGTTIAGLAYWEPVNVYVYTKAATWTLKGTTNYVRSSIYEYPTNKDFAFSGNENTIAFSVSDAANGVHKIIVFEWNGSQYAQQQVIFTGAAYNAVGFCMALSYDGNTLVTNMGNSAPAIYTRSGTTWTNVGTLPGGSGSTADSDIQFAADDSILMTSSSNSTAYIYKVNNGVFTLDTSFPIVSSSESAHMSDDGKYVIAGNPQSSSNAGEVKIYKAG